MVQKDKKIDAVRLSPWIKWAVGCSLLKKPAAAVAEHCVISFHHKMLAKKAVYR